MNDKVKIRIDGRTVEAPVGSTILDVARQEEIYIPTLCHSPLLRPLENCRLCIVSVAGEAKYKASCSTLVAENMDITTNSQGLRQTRKLLLELLLDTHYGDCVAPCSVACPANVDIQGYLACVRQGEYGEAVRLIKEKIPMPSTIGRVCPHFCEAQCRRNLVDEQVKINFCKRFVSDYEMTSGERILPVVPPSSGRAVAIIGGGPAGLSAAYYLRTLGHAATIFEARDKLGGMLRYGIPEYRLPKKILDWEIDGILSLGVGVKTGVCWGEDFTVDDLRREGYDAIFMAIGAWAARKLGIVGEDLAGVDRGIDFLEAIESNGHRQVKVGKRVAIIGGGNVAIDAARSALRLGAEKVTILYRRSRNEMPASHEEIEAAQEEGVNIQFLVAPSELSGENGAVRSLQFIRMELGEPDSSGRRRPVPVAGSEVRMDVDQVISAIGQFPDIPSVDADSAMSRIPTTRWSTIGGDPRSMHTGQEMVFVGGDVFRGPDTVVAALADGRKAAYSLDRSFRVGEVQAEPLHFNISKGDLETIDREPFSVLKTIPRELMPEIEVSARIGNFEEVELGLGEESAKREAARCLVCGCSAAFDCRLRELMNEFQVDWRNQPSKKIHYQHVAAADFHPDIALDPNKCIRCERCHVACSAFQVSDAINLKDWARINDRCVTCGLCVDLCPTGALMDKREERAIERLDWKQTKTHCINCGVGCALVLNAKGDKQIWVSDGSYEAPGWSSTCSKGRFRSYDSVWYGDRVLKPMVRQGGSSKEVTLVEAVEALLRGLRDVHARNGSKALYALASPRSTNEGLYLLQKWWRTGWKSHALDFPGRETREELWGLTRENGGMKGVHFDLKALEQARAIFVVGNGVEDMAPVVATMIRRAARSREVPVWQLASGEDGLTSFCSVAVHADPEDWKDLLHALGAALLNSGRVSSKTLELNPETLNIFKTGKNFTPPEKTISADKWDQLKQGFTSLAPAAFVFPEDLLQSKETAEAVRLLVELARVSSHVDDHEKPAFYALTRSINSSGALLMGVSPSFLPGFAGIDTANAERFMQIWHTPEFPDEPFLGINTSFEDKRVKGLFIQDAAGLLETDANRWKQLMSQVEFLVIQESVPSAAMDFADVVIPVAAFGEQSGSITNFEGRVFELARGLDYPGMPSADWEVLARIMRAHGVSFPKDVAAVRREMSKLVPEFSASGLE